MLNIAEENRLPSKHRKHICILANCSECLQRTTELIFILVFKGRFFFVMHLWNVLNDPFFFFPLSLCLAMFSPPPLSAPCFPPCFLPWPAYFSFPPLATSLSWALSLVSFCLSSLSYLTCSSPQMRAQSESSSPDPAVCGLLPSGFS